MYRGRRQPVFERLRVAAGEELMLDRNVLVERILPASVLRPLTEAEMGEYRRPFAVPGEGRLPTLVWPRQIPIGGQPADVHQVCTAYAAWLASAPGLSKLFVNAEPGSILAGPVREFCRTGPDPFPRPSASPAVTSPSRAHPRYPPFVITL